MVVAGAPIGLEPLIGREAELTAIRAALGDHAVVTLTGPGGTGKTRLALAVADLEAADMRATFVDLSAVDQAGDVPGAIAAALGVNDSTGSDLAGAIAATFASDAFVVLDNFEQVLAARAFVTALADAAPKLRLLTTSRIPLAIRGEHAIPIAPLALPDSAELFLERSRERGGRQALNATEADAVVAICRRLDGLPLALELAAAWTRLLSPRAILRRLDEGRLQLGPGEAGRHESLERVVESTLLLVERPDRDVFDQVAVFVDGFDEAGAIAVTGVDSVLANLRRLEATALIRSRPDLDGEPRFGMLETIRAVAARRLASRSDAEEVRRRFVADAAARAQVAADALRDVIDQGSALRWMTAESANLRSAYRSAVEHGDAPHAVQLAMTLATFGVRAGNPRESLRRVREALAIGPVPPGIRSEALCAVVNLSMILNEPGDVAPMCREAVELARATGDRRREARAWVALGSYGSGPERIPVLQEASAFSKIVGYAWAVNVANSNLASALLEAHRPNDALPIFREELRAAEARGDEEGTCYALNSIAEILLDGGNMDSAFDYATRAAEVTRRYWPTSSTMTATLVTLATCQVVVGRTDDAFATVLEACQVAQDAASEITSLDVLTMAIVAFGVEQPSLAARAAAHLEAMRGGERPGFAIPASALRAWDATERRLGPRRWARELQAGRERSLAAVVEEVRAAAATGHRTATRVRAEFGTLTSREAEVLPLLARGLTDPEIAATLCITAKTASVHVANIKAKLGADTRIDASVRAREIVTAQATHPNG